MNHEPECFEPKCHRFDKPQRNTVEQCAYCTCICEELNDAYRRGREDIIASLHQAIQRSEAEPQPSHGGNPTSWSDGYTFAMRKLLSATHLDGEACQ